MKMHGVGSLGSVFIPGVVSSRPFSCMCKDVGRVSVSRGVEQGGKGLWNVWDLGGLCVICDTISVLVECGQSCRK